MDPEYFQQMMQTVAELSGDAKEFGIWYLIAHAVVGIISPLLTAAGFVLSIVFLGRAAAKIVDVASDGRVIAQALGVECVFGGWGGQHRRDALSRIKTLQTENREMREVFDDRNHEIAELKRQLEVCKEEATTARQQADNFRGLWEDAKQKLEGASCQD